MEDYYIFSSGNLKKKNNTIFFNSKDNKIFLPVEKIKSIYFFGEINISSKIIEFFGKKGIILHFFDYYDNYVGSFYPKRHLIAGEVIIKQCEHYLNKKKRLFLAKSFLKGGVKNMMKILAQYNLLNDTFKKLIVKLDYQTDIPSLMGIEGNIRDMYYALLDKILIEPFKIIKRERRPPKNYTNALISFGNQLLYTLIVKHIYYTQLNPSISYLHEPFYRRFSLALDVSEIFKPFFVDRLILKLINLKIIKEEHFRKELNGILLNEYGKKIFIKEFENRKSSVIYHKTLKRKVKYETLIRLELYKLIKHLLDIKKYKPFMIWW